MIDVEFVGFEPELATKLAEAIGERVAEAVPDGAVTVSQDTDDTVGLQVNPSPSEGAQA